MAFELKAVAYPKIKHLKVHLCLAPASLANIRQAKKDLPGTNDLAYLAYSS